MKINRKSIITLVILVGLIFAPQLIRSIHWTRVLIEIFLWTTLSLGFRLILTSGLVSLAQVSFMGLGAYTVAILTTKFGVNYWICLPLAGVVSAFFALIIGVISLRSRDIYFAIATFAIAEVIRLTWIEWRTLFGGVGGIASIPSPNPIFGLKFGSTLSFYYLSLCIVILTIIVMHRLEVSSFGRILLTFEEEEDLALSVGINPFKLKTIAFVIGSFFAGLAGAGFAPFYHYIGPQDFSIHQTFFVLVFVITGGAGTIYGTMIGVFTVTVLLKLLHHLPGFNPVWEPLFLGCILLIVMKFVPGGLISLPERISSLLKYNSQEQTPTAGEDENVVA